MDDLKRPHFGEIIGEICAAMPGKPSTFDAPRDAWAKAKARYWKAEAEYWRAQYERAFGVSE